MDKFSYSLGIVMAQNLKNQGITEFDETDLAKGIKDVISNEVLEVSIDEANQIIQSHLQAAAAKHYAGDIETGAAFLAENGKRDGITSLPSGLQYEVIQTGDGATPKATDTVTTHYHGSLIDGTVFDSSVNRGEPASFPVNGVIAGWTEALQLMTVGSKWRLFVPYNLAYGDRGAGQVIKPFATLIFEVELLEIK